MKQLLMAIALLGATVGWAQVPADAIWIDVRSGGEFQSGHLEGATHIPWDGIEKGVNELGLEKSRPIYLYCGSGGRAERARSRLQAAGFSAVVNAGGLADAKALAAQD